MGDTIPSFQTNVCGLCKGTTKRVIPVAGPNGTTLVGRCMVCDTLPCPKCKSRNIEPSAKDCKHCGASLNLNRRK